MNLILVNMAKQAHNSAKHNQCRTFGCFYDVFFLKILTRNSLKFAWMPYFCNVLFQTFPTMSIKAPLEKVDCAVRIYNIDWVWLHFVGGEGVNCMKKYDLVSTTNAKKEAASGDRSCGWTPGVSRRFRCSRNNQGYVYWTLSLLPYQYGKTGAQYSKTQSAL